MTDDSLDETAARTDPLTAPEIPKPASGRNAPVPKQKRPGKYRVPPRKDRHGLFILNTGEGKGKTTAALGLLLRATGRGMRAGMFQFIKRLDDAGEHVAATRLGVEIIALGHGCTLGRSELTDDMTLAQTGWQHCVDLIARGEYDVLILDELTLPIKWGWINNDDAIAAIKTRPQGTHVVVTGRDASAELIAAADLVTEMRAIKHPYHTERLGAQAGIDV
ncbi:MAG: cob(I)yrinic acid a,c-diamide adenosyltransferase [Gemmatimonadaceae bacterium]